MKIQYLGAFLLLTTFCFGQNMCVGPEAFVPRKDNYSFSTINFNVPAFDYRQKMDSVSFEGSLILPKDGFDKVVIIKPGTGYNTRNTHSPLAEALLDNHTAVFRYDERGKGNSKGEGGGDMTYTVTMMGEELVSAFNMVKKHPDLQGKKIGIIGHSLGGIAVLEALEHEINPDFLVLFAAPVVTGKQLFLYQLQHSENGFNDYFLYDTLEEKQKVCSELIDFYLANQKEKSFWKVYKKEAKKLGYTKKRYATHFRFLLGGGLDRDLVSKDRIDWLKNTTIPVFYMIGAEDVLVDPVANTTRLNNLANPAISATVLEGENHFFSDGESTPYAIHEQPKQKIVEWIVKQ
ncbi:alpha/beta hydrolase family protein [Myroides fluvii]|uniref:alpha/beta hydrolase family protein n=1 Tax=Myroides fluvii TaxID=2572594 RepID=UPI00131CE3F5|nr:alpha/beta hydrolase [Myroides fluvii]